MRAKYIVLGLMLSAALTVSARTFDAGERLYINMEASSVKSAGGDLASGWYSTTNNYNYAYFFKGSNAAWSSQVKQYKGTVWYVEAPAGDWEYVILTRHSSANASWDNKITQTGNIWFYYKDGSETKMRDQNYIANFYYGENKEEAGWEYVAPDPSGNPATWTLPYEDEQICRDAAGTTYKLQAKNYDYDNTYAHAWFKYESGSWTRIQGDEWRTNEGDKAFDVTLGGVNSDVYYFLQCSRPTMCRLIRVRINQDCSEGAPGACKITSFVAVASEANVTDKKTIVNGVVAFDDKKNAGKLQIWCPGVDTIVVENEDIETPQTFKIKGFDASTSKTYTLYAKFLSGEGCEASCQVKVTPPSATPTEHTTTGTVGDESLTRFTEVDVKLTPDNQSSTYFMWTNTANNDTITTGDRNQTFTAPTEAQDIVYYFLATKDPPSPEGNLITNGTFEDVSLDSKLESDYAFWGRDLSDYYTTHKDASGGYAITKNANTFWYEFQSVKAHEGSYFGLFDSKIYDGNDQAAWIAKSGTKNPKLKVETGVSYLFSFWVANINAYYQMNNGARLQFQISYDGGPWNNLGQEIDLGKFKDSRWHGMSSIVKSTITSSNVALRVINLNKSLKNIGNDFALDDIRFEAITANSSNIDGYESFPVKYIKCDILSATFEQMQPVGCGTTVADVKYTINFVNPRGDLYIYEGATLLAKINHDDLTSATSHTGILANQPVDDADHVMTVYFKDALVQTDAPTTYTYNAKAVPAISVKRLEWGQPDCDVSTTTLTAVINYVNQNGSLTASVDGGTAIPPQTYSIEKDDLDSVKLVIPGVAADGKLGHKLNVTFNGSHGCSIVDFPVPTVAPVVPHIDTLNIKLAEPKCGELNTTLFFDLDYTYQQGDLKFHVDGMPDSIRTGLTTSKSKQTIAKLFYVGVPADGKVHTLYVEFDGANSCKKSYKLPAAPFSPVIDAVKIVSTSPKVTDPKVSDTLTCSTDSYTVDVEVTLHYDPTGLGKNIQLDYNDGKNPQTKTELATGKTTTISGLTMYNIDDTASLHTIYAQLLGYTPACPDSVKYRAPIRARIQPNFKVKVSEVGCDVTKYTLSGTVNFDKADGNLVVAFINESKSQTITVPAGSKSANFSISGVDSVGTGMQLKAWFTGSATAACEVLSKPFDSPAIPKIDTLNIKLSEPKCGELNTTLTFDLAYTYQQGTLTYWVDALTAKKATYNIQKASPDTLKALTFADIPADGKSHALHVEFDGANSCKKSYKLPAAPFSPVIDAVKIVSTSPKVTDLSVSDTLTCSTDSYTVDVEVTLHYDPTGLSKNIQLDYNDGKNPQTTSKSADAQKVTFTGLTMQNIDDTASLHTIYAQLVGYTPACPDSVKYRAPIRARIQSNFAVTVGETTCCKTNYTLSGTVNFDKADGNLVVAFIDGSKSQTITVPAGSKSADFSFSNVDSVGKGMQLKAWFTGSATSACEVLSKSFDSPAIPKIDTLNVKYNPLACTDLTATLLFDLEYIYQQGALSYWVDDMTPISGPTYKVKQATPDTLKALSFAGIPADGKAHTLEVKFAHANDCDKTYTLPAAPFSPVINSISVTGTPSKVFCNVNEYLATVTINVPYDALGQKIILSYDDKGGTKDTTITVNSDNADVAGKVITVKLTLHNMDSLAQTVKAAFATSPTCTTPSAPYTPPALMTCEKYYATICEGENYDGSLDTPKNDFKINTPPVGVHTFTIPGLTDTLFLTVVAIPRISTGTMAVTCDDESSIHIPFTVTNGDPDTIDIKIIGCDTCKYVGTISGSDIVFARAPELVAGDYSAWVVTGHKGSVCKDSVQVNFSIALGGAMYSKWTDVIFINNAGNQFIAYEWYENGVALDGETMQRLYKPEGLTGTYYCRLTKTDGKIISTCEQSFDKIQPSRSAGDPSAAQVVRKYRVSPHVYIIQTVREDGFVDTKKVLTPYE